MAIIEAVSQYQLLTQQHFVTHSLPNIVIHDENVQLPVLAVPWLHTTSNLSLAHNLFSESPASCNSVCS